jgi:hypothetical protein
LPERARSHHFPHHRATQAGGAAGLEAALRAELLAARPEFLRQRPKYYYYYEWMRKRITAQVLPCWYCITWVC